MELYTQGASITQTFMDNSRWIITSMVKWLQDRIQTIETCWQGISPLMIKIPNNFWNTVHIISICRMLNRRLRLIISILVLVCLIILSLDALLNLYRFTSGQKNYPVIMTAKKLIGLLFTCGIIMMATVLTFTLVNTTTTSTVQMTAKVVFQISALYSPFWPSLLPS